MEDNSEDFIVFDESQTNSIGIIKSVIKKVIGKYELFGEEELVEVKHQIAKVSGEYDNYVGRN